MALEVAERVVDDSDAYPMVLLAWGGEGMSHRRSSWRYNSGGEGSGAERLVWGPLTP